MYSKKQNEKRRALPNKVYSSSTPCKRFGHLKGRNKYGNCMECQRVDARVYWKEYRNKIPKWARLISQAKRRSKLTGREYSLTAEWARATWTGYCAITGVKFGTTENTLASIDRINNKKGYTPANCRFILKRVNTIKHTNTDEFLLEVAKRIIKAHEDGRLAI